MAKRERERGKRGERMLAEWLRERGFSTARRGQQRSGLDTADVIGGPEDWHIECKFVERLNPWNAYAQAETDAAGKTPVVFARRARSDWLVILRAEDLLRLLGRAAAPTS